MKRPKTNPRPPTAADYCDRMAMIAWLRYEVWNCTAKAADAVEDGNFSGAMFWLFEAKLQYEEWLQLLGKPRLRLLSEEHGLRDTLVACVYR